MSQQFLTIAEALAQAQQQHQAGNLQQAEELYRQILQHDPRNADALHLLGLIAHQVGKNDLALIYIGKAIAIAPSNPFFHNNMGEAYRSLSRFDDAIASYQQTLRLKPDIPETHTNLGDVLQFQGKFGVAVACYQQALRCKADFVKAHNNLGAALRIMGKLTEAVTHLDQARQLEPDFAAVLNNLGGVLQDQGRLDPALACYQEALHLQPDYADAHSNYLLTLNYHPGYAPSAVFAAHRRWAEVHAPLAMARSAPATEPDPDRRLRIGYVSPDLRTHSVAFFLAPILAHHDPRRVEAICYAEVAAPDATTAHLQTSAHGWRRTYGLSDAQMADLIHADGIDILVDLAGHTSRNRLRVFACKPAPVQITYLGYPNTTGVPAIEYRLTDAWADPVTQPHLHTEELVRLPHGFLCYAPPQEAPPVAALPARRRGQVTFGSCNNLSKINAAVVALWAQILQALPTARLCLKTKPFGDQPTRERYHHFFAQHDICRERVDLHGHQPNVHDHLAFYDTIDIALDPFPYNGTTTTYEALWMGTPVITLAGRAHAGRVGTSILSRLGRPQWIADTPEQYVALAVGLARDLDQLDSVRIGLRQQILDAGLCDGNTFTHTLEMVYRTLWQRWCARRRTQSP